MAGGGIRGIPEFPLRADEDDEDDDEDEEDATDVSVLGRDFEASDLPGATAETSAANPAVSIAAPAITQRRVRLIRSSAASRASAARECV